MASQKELAKYMAGRFPERAWQTGGIFMQQFSGTRSQHYRTNDFVGETWQTYKILAFCVADVVADVRIPG